MSSYYNQEELHNIGFAGVGENVLISKKCSIYGAGRIIIKNNVRIDDFCVISAGKGGIEIGSYVHIAVYCNMQGDGKIVLEDFCGLSSKVSIYSSNEDYFGRSLTNPTVPDEYRTLITADVLIKKHCIIGSSSLVLPGVTISEGVAIAAFSLVNKNCDEFSIYMGNPLKKLMKRSRKLLLLEKELQDKQLY